MSKDRARLLDILDWARAAMKEAAGRTRADFDTDENFFLAQVKRVEVVGEAASRLTPDTCRLMPEVPWAAVSAMRNRLVHRLLGPGWLDRSSTLSTYGHPSVGQARLTTA